MIETYKFRIYPTDKQKVLLNQHFGAVRFIYNWALDFNQKRYAANQKYLNSIGLCCSGDLVKLKEENPWLYDINAQSLICSIGHLDKAYNNFFAGRSGFPKFKSKKFDKNSFEIPQKFSIDFKKSRIKFPKFSRNNTIRVVISRKVKKGKIGTATISKNQAGQYFVSFIVHTDEQTKQISPSKITKENSIGFDFGLKHFITTSNGDKIKSPEFFKHTLKKLAKEQRKFSRKQKGSNNREKQRIKVAKVHNQIANQRGDFLHKLSTKMVKESQFDCFCIEDLNIKGMTKLWGRKVSDLSWYTFTQMLNYKTMKYGKILKKIGRFDASSQICSKCGNRQKLSLEERTYHCPECGLDMDRDVNAAINIRNFALRDFIKNTDGTSGINACGDESSRHCDFHNDQTIVNEARKSNDCHYDKEEHLKITSFKM